MREPCLLVLEHLELGVELDAGVPPAVDRGSELREGPDVLSDDGVLGDRNGRALRLRFRPEDRRLLLPRLDGGLEDPPLHREVCRREFRLLCPGGQLEMDTREQAAPLEVPHPGEEQERQRDRRTDQPGRDQRRPSADGLRHRPRERVGQGHEPDRDEPVEARDAPEQTARHQALLRGDPHDEARALERVEREAEDHRLPGQPRDAVAGDRERRDRPHEVHEGHVTPRHLAVAHDDRGDHRPDPAEREDEAEVARRAPHLLLHHEGEQRVGRAPEDEVGERRRQERSPQPRLRPDVPEALADVVEHRGRRRVLVALDPVGSHEDEARDRDRERQPIDDERPTRPPTERGDEPAADRGTGHPERCRAYELVERVRPRELVLGHQVRNDRVERRTEERRARAVERGDHHHVPDPDLARQRQQPEDRHGRHPDRVRRDHDLAAVEPVAHGTADQQQHHLRQRHREPDHGERRRQVRDLVRLPCERDRRDAVPEQRDGHAGPQQAELPVP